MKVSLKWLSDWVDLDGFKNPQEIADLLTARGLEVESVTAQARGLEKVISAQIIQKVKHPEADRLSLCKVNPGNNEYLDIVCGAQNMKVGDIVALAQVGAELPNGMKIAAGKIRGAVSNGMLCSEEELGLKSQSEGILILPVKTPVGWSIIDVLGVDDTIFEVKLTANRGDCLSHRGLAREIAAAIGKPLKDFKVPTIDFQVSGSIHLDAGDLAPQFFGINMQGAKVGPTPEWMRRRLEAIGQRSINNLVDASNYLMFELGYPVHIYDADKLEGTDIHVRQAKKGEPLKLLDGGDVTLTGEELVIADSVKAVGLAGVMGGGNSEVTESTKRIYLECAEFHPTTTRRSAFSHQRRSEASLRFEKGIDVAGLKYAVSRLADLVTRISAADVVSASYAHTPSREKFTSAPISVSSAFINHFLGTAIAADKMLENLAALDCQVDTSSATSWKVSPPSYRLDLKIPQDVAEEIARCVGYDTIPSTIPVLTGMPKLDFGNPASHRLQTMDRMKDQWMRSGLSEVLTYAFQSEAWLARFALTSTVKILNPISIDQGFMVPSLVPGLIKAYQENERHHFGSDPLAVRLFEIRPVFHFKGNTVPTAFSEMDTGVQEDWHCSVMISGPRYDQALKEEQAFVDFFDLKALIEQQFESLGTKGIRYRVLSAEHPRAAWLHGGQALEIVAGKDVIGFMGRMHPKMESDLKVRHPIYFAEFKVQPVIDLTPTKKSTFKAWSSFPTMERDFALLVKDTVSAENLVQSALKHGKPIAKVVKIFDTYKGTHVPAGMVSIGVRVIFSDETKSLEEKQVDSTAEVILKKWESELDAKQR